jgi:hypothetical protein
MPAFDEFRLVVQPAITAAGQWTVRIDESPIKLQVGNSATLQPTLTRQQLEELRQAGWVDLGKLKGIGENVWASVLSHSLGASLEASAQVAAHNGRRLRLVLVRLGTETEVVAPGQVAVAELPFEALCHPVTGDFFAVDNNTPVSRGLQVRPDRSAQAIPPPLRVLLMAADPKDKANAESAAEVAAIQQVLAPLGDVQVTVCNTGLYDDLRQVLNQVDPHVVHFAGHGGYAVVGDDPTPRPHLCFVRPDNGNTFEVDADTLAVAIKNRNVRLVVLTACASAAPGPPGMPYYCRALEGIAQRLVLGTSGVSAAIAMQFDLEVDAAVTFSQVFYRHLLDPDLCLDEAVTLARKEITQTKSLGHRAWVNPTVFWRCVDARVFDLDTALDAATLPELRVWEVRLDANLKFVTDFANDQGFGSAQAQRVFTNIREVELRRSELYRQCLRLTPETTAAGGQVLFHVLLRISSPGTIEQLAFRVILPAGLFLVKAEGPGGVALPAAQVTPSVTDIVVNHPSANAVWPVGEKEVALLRVAVDGQQTAGLLSPSIENTVMRKNGDDVKLRTLNPILFVHRV